MLRKRRSILILLLATILFGIICEPLNIFQPFLHSEPIGEHNNLSYKNSAKHTINATTLMEDQAKAEIIIEEKNNHEADRDHSEELTEDSDSYKDEKSNETNVIEGETSENEEEGGRSDLEDENLPEDEQEQESEENLEDEPEQELDEKIEVVEPMEDPLQREDEVIDDRAQEKENAIVQQEDANKNQISALETKRAKPHHTYTQDTELITPQQGLIGVIVLNNPVLNTSLNYNDEGKPVITLSYYGEGLINLNLISSTYIIFQVPEPIAEIMSKDKMRAFYDVPGLGLLGIEIRKDGEFSPNTIEVDGEQVYMRFDDLLSLNLLNYTYYQFDLHIELPYIPYTPSGQYTFVSQATKQVVDLSIVEDPVAVGVLEIMGVLEFYQVPETISFQTTPISTLPQYIKRERDSFSISIKDTRGYDAPWRIDAKISKPLTLTTNHRETLVDAIKFKLNDGTELTLSNQAQTIVSSKTKENQITELTWDSNEGPLIYMNPNEVKVGDYKTEIIWTLVDAP